ncbi:MAG: division/cell wall cluster transcriptional repressor MraZ [Burkholderiaceae bacterium]
MPELVFQGTSALTLDAKGRVAVPTRHRDALMKAVNGELTVTRHPRGYLLVLPRPAWHELRERLINLPMDADGWRRIFLGSAVDVEIDAGSRIHISPELRSRAALTRDVLMIGMGQRLELWDAARYAAHEAEVTQGPMPDVIKSFVF